MLTYLKIGMPKSSLYQRMKVTLSWALGMLISQGRLTVELASAVITVTLPPEMKEKKIVISLKRAILGTVYSDRHCCFDKSLFM